MQLYDYSLNLFTTLQKMPKGKSDLISFKDSAIITPLSDNSLDLFEYRTKLRDEVIQQELVNNFLKDIVDSGKYKGINHIGFCYKVDNKNTEVKRICEIVKKSDFHVYEEPSNNKAADWIFVGNIEPIDSILIEFIPHLGTSKEKWFKYWFPNIHFDIDTDFSPDEIVCIIRKYIKSPNVPHPFQINGITYFHTVRLGCLQGVNINLCISNRNRDLNYRKNWNKLV